jgi:alanyl-tRNA synthetase
MFKILSESSIASGIRRIEAVTGKGVEEFIHSQAEAIKMEEEKVEQLQEEKRKLEKEIAELSLKSKLGGIDSILQKPSLIDGVTIYKGKVQAANMDELKAMGDELRLKMKEAAGVLISEFDSKVGIVCVVSDNLMKSKNLAAGKIVGDIAKIVGGGGGGRPHLATAGGKDITKINEALDQVENVVKKYL